MWDAPLWGRTGTRTVPIGTMDTTNCVCGNPLERVTADLYMCKFNHHTLACVVCYAPTFNRNGKITCETQHCSGNQFKGQ